VNAFDYFLSVGPKEELEQVLEDLTELLGDPVKLAKKMLSIGQEVYEESYKGIKEAGGFKNYLSQKDGEIEKLQKKIDKLETKLAQYEDFDQPRYRMDETGSPEMGEVESSKPANDTLSTLFDERDKVRRK
jgi:predicted translin family RNA/ssDNA-binding protein